MDTQEGLLQRDLVTEGAASVEFRTDTAFLQELYALVCEDGFLDIRRPMISQELTTDDTLVAVMPNCWYEIRVTKNAEQYLICGDMTAAAYTQTDADAACFMKTVEALLGLVKGTSAWASLQEPNAAYERSPPWHLSVLFCGSNSRASYTGLRGKFYQVITSAPEYRGLRGSG